MMVAAVGKQDTNVLVQHSFASYFKVLSSHGSTLTHTVTGLTSALLLPKFLSRAWPLRVLFCTDLGFYGGSSRH